MITLYLLPGGTPEERKRAELSYQTVPIKVVSLPVDRFDLYGEEDHVNPWFAFLYGYEYLDENLRNAIPLLVQNSNYDIFIFFKKVYKSGNMITSQAPRLFRKHIRMQPLCLLPATEDLYSPYERILDGWILQDAHDEI